MTYEDINSLEPLLVDVRVTYNLRYPQSPCISNHNGRAQFASARPRNVFLLSEVNRC